MRMYIVGHYILDTNANSRQLSASLIRPGPDLIVVDEAQRIKEKESQVFVLKYYVSYNLLQSSDI